MRKVELIRGNRVYQVDGRLAPLLEARGGYLRRDMVAQQPEAIVQLVPESQAAPAPEDNKLVADSKADKATRAAKKVAKKAASKAAPDKDSTE